jgi:hypothetical protein
VQEFGDGGQFGESAGRGAQCVGEFAADGIGDDAGYEEA